MIIRLLIIVLLLSSCATYKRRIVVKEWISTYDVVYTVEKVSVFDRKTDTLISSRIDTTVMYYNEWRAKREQIYGPW